MHFRKYKSIISNKNGINLYRGCTHGCIYCDSRSTCYQMNHDFEDVEVKEDAPNQFREQLSRKKKKAMISFGAMSDPYMPLEKELQYTRKCLQSIYDYGFGVSIQTKSDLILRDLDILKKINSRTKCVVNITLTTFDDSLCSIVEPNVCLTSRRLEVLKILNENNIKTVVWLCPILPFINDNKENIYNIVNACAKVGVYGIINFGMALTLRDGDRQYFYKNLDKSFPNLKQRYINIYKNNYVLPSLKGDELMDLFYQECFKNKIRCDANKLFEFLSIFVQKEIVQLSLF